MPVTTVLGPAGDLGLKVLETHSAVLFFMGDRVYKLKKAVDLGFLDHRDEATRAAVCHREVALNRRLAPDVYLGVWDVSGPDGVPCDHLVVMRRMPDDRNLTRCVRAGEDVDDALRHIAHLVATLHAGEPPSPRAAELASVAAVRRNWTDGFDQLHSLRAAGLDTEVCDRIEELVGRYLDGRDALLTRRIDEGWVRDGHGDLMADDIYLLPDGPRILDCLEFDERYRINDVLADVAFLAMDLERIGRPDLARRFLALYREMAGGTWPPSLAHHHIAYRAHVRAKVGAIRQVQAGLPSDAKVDGLLRLTLDHLERARVRLVLVGGLPGTGKSTLAEGVADTIDATVLRTDEVRQRMAADTIGDRYSEGARRAVYHRMLAEAGDLLRLGHHVVLDATWQEAEQRGAARDLARETSSDLVELECRAPADVAARRIEARLARGDDASEATPAVAAALASAFAPWPEAVVLATTGPPTAALAGAAEAVGWPGPDAAPEG